MNNFRIANGLLPYLIVLIAGVTWAITFSLAKIAISSGAHPLGLTLWQSMMGALIMAVICTIRRSWPVINRSSLFRISVIAVAGTTLPATLYFYAATRVTAGILALTIALVPILTYGAALCFRSESYSTVRVAGIGCGFIGVIILTRPEALPDPTILPWIGLALLCAVCYTVENMFVELCIPKDTSMEGLLLGSLAVSSLILFSVVTATDSYVSFEFPFGSTEWSVVSMAVINCLAYLSFLYLIRYCGAVFASMMGYVVTLAGVVWGIVLFSETYSVYVWTTLGLLLLGMFLVRPVVNPVPDDHPPRISEHSS